MGIVTSLKIRRIPIIVVGHISYGWSCSGNCWTLWWLGLLLFLLEDELFHHFGKDLLPHVVLPKYLFFGLGLQHQATDPQIFLLGVFDELVDVCHYLFGSGTIFRNAFFVVLEDPHHFMEVVLVLFELDSRDR